MKVAAKVNYSTGAFSPSVLEEILISSLLLDERETKRKWQVVLLFVCRT